VFIPLSTSRKMEPMDYEMESPVATQRGMHSLFAQRAQDHRQALGYQNRTVTQHHNFDQMNVDPLSTQHFYRTSNFPGGVSMHYEAGFSQGTLQSNASMNPPNPLFFQNLPGPRFPDLETIITTHPIFNRSLHQTDSFHGQRPYRTPAATGPAMYPNPSFSTRTSVPPPVESNQMEYPQAPLQNWAMPPIGASNQYQPPASQLESFQIQNYSGIPELEYSANRSFHEHSIPSAGSGISPNVTPDQDLGTTRFGAYQHTQPSTSYANLGTRNDVNADIAQFRDRVIPGSGSHTESEIAAAIDVYFRTGEFQRVMEGLSNDERADPGRPQQDFEAFLERLPRSVLQRQPNRPPWTEPRHRGRERSSPETSREMNQGDQARMRATDPHFVAHVAHIPGAREQILRDNFTSRRPARAFERATVKAINGLQDVPIDSLPEEDRTCNICMDPFGEMEPINGTSETPVRLPCGHVFGYICIKTWLKEHCTCPTCRRKLESEIVHSHSPSHQFRERIRVAHRLGLEHTTPPESNDSQRPAHAPDRAARIRPSRRERDSSHNTTMHRYEGAMSRTHSIGPSDVPEDISPTHPRVGFTRSRSNAFSTGTAPSAARSLYSSLNENTEIDHLGSIRQQPRRRDAAPLRPPTMSVRASLAAGTPRRQVNHGGPAGPSHGHARVGFGGADVRQHNGASDDFRFTSGMLANSPTYPTNDSPTC
jgi:Ring finger domain